MCRSRRKGAHVHHPGLASVVDGDAGSDRHDLRGSAAHLRRARRPHRALRRCAAHPRRGQRRPRRDPVAQQRPLPRVPVRGAVGRRRPQPDQHAVERAGGGLLPERLRLPRPAGRRRHGTARACAPRAVPAAADRDPRRRRPHARRDARLRGPPGRGHAHPRRAPRRRQPGRPLLHGRHHRLLQGRDAQPPQPGDVGDGLHRHRRVRVGRRHLPARGADVPRRRPGRRSAARSSASPTSSSPGSTPRWCSTPSPCTASPTRSSCRR